ncbi:MAG: flavodoxin domain-containing protein [Chloroflexota bacterium]|nr:flavodoxin domain-containing protein [Chloroflexota bacterium]
MKTLIAYDSMYGNTEQIAHSIGRAIAGEVKVVLASEADSSELEVINWLIVGSPTQGFRATESVQTFVSGLSAGSLKGINVAAFDTRMTSEDVGRGLRLIMKVGGYAAPRIAKVLEKKGGNLMAPPTGFFVKDKEGPLKEGELERAASWAKEITPAL